MRPLQAFNLERKGHWNTNSGKMLAESHLVAPSPDLAHNMALSPPYIPTLWQKAGLPSTQCSQEWNGSLRPNQQQLQRYSRYTQPHPQDVRKSKQAMGTFQRGDGNPGLLTSFRPAGLPRWICFCFCLWWWLLQSFNLLLKSSFPLCLRNPQGSEALSTKVKGSLSAG